MTNAECDYMLFDAKERPLWVCKHCGAIQPVLTKGVTLADKCLCCDRKLVPQNVITLNEINAQLRAAESREKLADKLCEAAKYELNCHDDEAWPEVEAAIAAYEAAAAKEGE